MADIKLAGGNVLLEGDINGSAQVSVFGTDGSAVSRSRGEAAGANGQGLVVAGLNDDNYRIQRMDRLGSSAVALNNVLLHEPFEGATQSIPNRFTSTVTNFVLAQTAAGGLNLNSTNITTIGSGVTYVSNKQFLKTQRQPLQAKVRARMGHVTNATMEIGFGATGVVTAAPTIGAYFQCTVGGVLQGVLTFNGTDITTSDMATSLPGGWQANYYTWDVIIDDDEVVFMIQNTASGLILAERRIQLPVTQVRLWNASHLPFFARMHFPTAPATAATMILTSIDVVSLDAFTNKPWAHTMACNGFGGETLPTTMGQAAQWANSAAPASATLSNTAAGYTTLGGLFQFAAAAGAATDYAIFGFTVPAPYTFVCTGIDIDAWNTGAAVATTPSLLVWGASPDQTAVSLATATNRRVALGAQSFPVGAAIGATADRSISRDFTHSPLVTNAGRFFVIVLRLPVGTATASQIIQGLVNVKGYFE